MIVSIDVHWCIVLKICYFFLVPYINLPFPSQDLASQAHSFFTNTVHIPFLCIPIACACTLTLSMWHQFHVWTTNDTLIKYTQKMFNSTVLFVCCHIHLRVIRFNVSPFFIRNWFIRCLKLYSWQFTIMSWTHHISRADDTHISALALCRCIE